jgi:chromosome segregation ATPase
MNGRSKPVRPSATKGPKRSTHKGSESDSSNDSEVERLASTVADRKRRGGGTAAKLKEAEQRGAMEAEVRAAQAAQLAVEHAVAEVQAACRLESERATAALREELSALESRAIETGTALAEASKRAAALEQQITQADDAFIAQQSRLEALSEELSASHSAHDGQAELARGLKKEKAALEERLRAAEGRAAAAEASVEELELAVLRARDICASKEKEIARMHASTIAASEVSCTDTFASPPPPR